MEYENYLDVENSDFNNASGKFKDKLKKVAGYTPVGLAIKGEKKLMESAKKGLEKRQERKKEALSEKRKYELEKIHAKQEAKLARIEARKERKLNPMRGQGFRDIIQAGANIVKEAGARGVKPEVMGAQIVSSDEAQTRLTNYVSKMGEKPAGTPEELAVQAVGLRENQINERLTMPPVTATTPEDAEGQLLSEEYQEDYIPEIMETGDEENFSNYVDPATWCASRMVAFSPFAQNILKEQREKSEMDNFADDIMDNFGKKDDNTILFVVLIVILVIFLGK